LKKSEKFSEIRENAVEISADFTELLVKFIEKSLTFPENRPDDSWTIFAETGRIFQEIGHWKEKTMKNVFLSCEVYPFSSTSPVLITHIIKLRINTLINPPGRLLTVNVWDVICI
jgi:hypothetical protein